MNKKDALFFWSLVIVIPNIILSTIGYFWNEYFIIALFIFNVMILTVVLRQKFAKGEENE